VTRPRISRHSRGEPPRRPRRRLGPRRFRPVREAVSAGGVVFRRTDHGIEVVLVGRTRDGLWALPKGTPDPGESLEETALREVREETGLQTQIVGPIGEIRYRFSNGDGTIVDKVVYHYLMQPVGGDISLHDDEFDVVRWCHISEAERLLTHRNQTPLLHRALDLIATLPQ
jgi:8-oxo-dGTP pyrophosphatase MutT (NUDIX family)